LSSAKLAHFISNFALLSFFLRKFAYTLTTRDNITGIKNTTPSFNQFNEKQMFAVIIFIGLLLTVGGFLTGHNNDSF
jgi:hypothetical protein